MPMPRTKRCPSGWDPLNEVAETIGLHVVALRKLLANGVFTPLRRTPGKNSKLYLLRTEVDAYLKGGIDAVASLKAAAKAKADTVAAGA
jgi:hypothetical protein